MKNDINERNFDNYEDIGNKPTKRVICTNIDGNIISPSTSDNQINGFQKTQITEDTLLLRRLVKLLESNATVDINNRQKVVVENLNSALQSVTGLSSGAGVATTNFPTANAPVSYVNTSYWLPVWIGPVDQRFQIMDAARLVYDQGIRSHLIFS